jgi:adenylate cyclase
MAHGRLTRRVGHGWSDPAETGEGLRLAREVLAAHWDEPAALHLAARALAALGADHETALTAVEHALALTPHSADAHNTAGFINAWLCRPDAAIAHLERAVRLSPLDPEMAHHLAGLALAHMIAGRYEVALELGLRAVREKPDWADAHRQVIMALSLLGRREEAEAAARRFRRVAPDKARVLANRARGLFADPAISKARIRALREAGLPE